MGGDKLTAFLLVGLIAFAVIIVDELFLRAAIALVPALLLAQRSMQTSTVPIASSLRPEGLDRRTDEEVRAHINDLLKELRDFYSACHLLANERIAPEEAKERAGAIERNLNRLLAEVTETAATPS